MARVEIACFNLDSASIAQQYGADRVELCAGMDVGGTTPSIADIKTVRERLSIALHVMVRPRGGDFLYAADELHVMKNTITEVAKLGVDGFVFGILNADKTVNVAQNKALVEWAAPLPCTFHRAFDEVPDPEKALEDVIACGFATILTSGGAPDVMAGLPQLKQLVLQAGDRITIMPGGGLRSTNIEMVQQQTAAHYYHSSAITDGGTTAVADEVLLLQQKLH
ncbi:copper homeostasis protein CutC [Sphingobacterium sp. Mn56C]|uniref:copper homeostasis protein CutC n=1 Tax=Sphingobacterium sp. Mn56C TaxID=3395261 RepID=UPI003BC2FB70